MNSIIDLPCTAGEDFIAIDDVIIFEIEDLQAAISTLVLDNLSFEGVEEFTANIEPVVGDFPVAVQNSSARVSIRDNDGLLLQVNTCACNKIMIVIHIIIIIVVVLGFEQPTYTVSEENARLTVSVNISHGFLEKNVVVSVETIGGSASGHLYHVATCVQRHTHTHIHKHTHTHTHINKHIESLYQCPHAHSHTQTQIYVHIHTIT